MKKQTIKEIIKGLKKSYICLQKTYGWYDDEKIENIIEPLLKSFKMTIDEELRSRIEWRVYECPSIIKRNGYVVCTLDKKTFRLKNINDFINYLLIIGLIED